jgi:hypothetical protein
LFFLLFATSVLWPVLVIVLFSPAAWLLLNVKLCLTRNVDRRKDLLEVKSVAFKHLLYRINPWKQFNVVFTRTDPHPDFQVPPAEEAAPGERAGEAPVGDGTAASGVSTSLGAATETTIGESK